MRRSSASVLENEDVSVDEILSHEFCVESHVATKMPSPHWHDHIELNYLRSGQMTYLIDGKSQRIGAGQLAIFWAATPHQVVSVSSDHNLSCAYLPLHQFLSLNLNPDFRQDIMQGTLLTGLENDPADAFDFARWAKEWAPEYDLRTSLIEEEVLVRVRRLSWDYQQLREAQSAGGQPGINAGQRAIEHAMAMAEFIRENFGTDISPNDVVSASGLHRSKASHAFAEVFGVSIGEYIRRQRVRQAMRLLVETDLKIAQVAFECGYQSLSRFYDAFKQRTGIPPLAYRKQRRHTSII